MGLKKGFYFLFNYILVHMSNRKGAEVTTDTGEARVSEKCNFPYQVETRATQRISDVMCLLF